MVSFERQRDKGVERERETEKRDRDIHTEKETETRNIDSKLLKMESASSKIMRL